MLYINTYGEIPVTLSIYKGDRSMVYYEDLTGEYEGLEVETVDEAKEDIKGNIENYFDCINGESKEHYVGVFAEHFNIDYSYAIENYADIKIKVLDIDLSKIQIDIED